jgi:hypothetical protein
MTEKLNYNSYYERIYKTKRRPAIEWDRLKPVDIVDIVLDDRATSKELQDLANRVMASRRGGRYDWVWKCEEVALEIAKSH